MVQANNDRDILELPRQSSHYLKNGLYMIAIRVGKARCPWGPRASSNVSRT